MKLANLAVLLILFLTPTVLAEGTASTPTPAAGRADCHDLDEVTYSPPRNEALKNIDITSLSPNAEELAKLGALKENRSPQGTKSFVMREADFMHPGPWSTVSYVFGNRAHPVRLRISFRDHGSGGGHAQWLNEKLLFADVWWGRFASTDLLIDVDTSKILYVQDADYSRIAMPCSEKAEGR